MVLGWKLLALCASAFSPSREFQETLLNYIRASYDGPDEYRLSLPLLAEFYVLRGLGARPGVMIIFFSFFFQAK